jgi:hypothetical protein
MPRVRPPVRLSARLLAVALALVCVIAAAALVCVEPPPSSACPIVIANPLRTRYRASDIVAVVRVGDSVAVANRVAVVEMHTALHITSLLKGESKEKVVRLEHYAPLIANAKYAGEYEKGDALLVFLRRAEKGEAYVPADEERGLQKLPDDDLKVYVRRIEELAVIMRNEKPDEAALAEWLVRCAEEPATRWEGAFELASNASLPQDPADEEATEDEENVEAETEAETDAPVVIDEEKQAEAGGSSAEPSAGETVDVDEQAIVVSEPGILPDPSTDFAALLTPAQKERLTTALLNAEELGGGEQLLIRLVGSWKDERLVPFVLKHLARAADKPPYYAEEMMRIVAHILGDPSLVKFVANYSKTVAYDDLYAGDAADGATYEEDPNAAPEERAAARKAFEEVKAAAAEALFQRSGKLRLFLALADQPQKP